ncbi:hypothetical protein AALC17_05220 [Oscillospiraceae bacterium 38-13]
MSDVSKKTALRKGKTFRELRAHMLESLELRGLEGKTYTSKVEEYMDLWCAFQMAKADVEANGVYLFDERGRRTKNDSAGLMSQLSRQMLAIFTALGFKAEESSFDSDEL